MRILLFGLLLLASCVTIKNPQNWNDDIALQKEAITQSYSYQGDTLTITEKL